MGVRWQHRSVPAVLVVLVLLVGLLPLVAAPMARAASGDEFVGIKPVRAADTRSGIGVRAGLVPAGQTLAVPVAGKFGVPEEAGAVSLNVTVTQPSGSGYVTVFPCGQPRPTASNLNFSTGLTVPNAVISGTGSGGAVCLFASAAAHVIVDVNGYFAAGAQYEAIGPVRAADTRIGTGVRAGVVGGGQTLTVPLAGKYGVPAVCTPLC